LADFRNTLKNKSHAYLFSGNLVVPCRWTDRQWRS